MIKTPFLIFLSKCVSLYDGEPHNLVTFTRTLDSTNRPRNDFQKQLDTNKNCQKSDEKTEQIKRFNNGKKRIGTNRNNDNLSNPVGKISRIGQGGQHVKQPAKQVNTFRQKINEQRAYPIRQRAIDDLIETRCIRDTGNSTTQRPNDKRFYPPHDKPP